MSPSAVQYRAASMCKQKDLGRLGEGRPTEVRMQGASDGRVVGRRGGKTRTARPLGYREEEDVGMSRKGSFNQFGKQRAGGIAQNVGESHCAFR